MSESHLTEEPRQNRWTKFCAAQIRATQARKPMLEASPDQGTTP